MCVFFKKILRSSFIHSTSNFEHVQWVLGTKKMRSSDSREALTDSTFGVVLGAVQRSPVTCHPG